MVPKEIRFYRPRFALILFKCSLSPTESSFILRINHKAIHQVLTQKIYREISHITIRMNKKMDSGTSTLTGFTADNPPKHKSDMIKAWNYTDMLAGNGLPPRLFSFLPPLSFTSLTHPLPKATSPSHFRLNFEHLKTAMPRPRPSSIKAPIMRESLRTP